MALLIDPSRASESSCVTPDTPSEYSLLFRLPLEVRLEIYSYLITDEILHVQPLGPYTINRDDKAVFSTELDNVLRGAEEQLYLEYMESAFEEVRPVKQQRPSRTTFGPLDLVSNTGYWHLFRIYCCTSRQTFESATACPPGYHDHADCCPNDMPISPAIRRTCRQAFEETTGLATDLTRRVALQFASVQDVMAFSMLLSDNQRESIRHIRVNHDGFGESSAHFEYFCNTFATPWDRRSVQHALDGSERNDKARISFYYNNSVGDLEHEPEKALASSWVVANIQLEWAPVSGTWSSWSTRFDLSTLRARAPLSVKLALPQLLMRDDQGMIHPYETSMYEEATGQYLGRDDEGFLSVAERAVVNRLDLRALLWTRKAIDACENPEQRRELQRSYAELFRVSFAQSNQAPTWSALSSLWQCQHFESFDIDFYDDDGLRSTMALEIAREGLKHRFETRDIGPHPCLFFTS